MGDNLPAIHRTAERDRQGRTQTILLDDSATADVRLALHQTLDTGALRHVDMKAGSGWCECDRHTALRVTPSRPETVEQMYSLLQACTGPEVDEEITLAHELHEGEAIGARMRRLLMASSLLVQTKKPSAPSCSRSYRSPNTRFCTIVSVVASKAPSALRSRNAHSLVSLLPE